MFALVWTFGKEALDLEMQNWGYLGLKVTETLNLGNVFRCKDHTHAIKSFCE